MTDSGSIGSHTAQCAALIAPYVGWSQATHPRYQDSCRGTGV